MDGLTIPTAPASGDETQSVVQVKAFESASPSEAAEGTGPRSLAFYRQALTKNLGPEVFKPGPSRMIWYGACAAGSILSFILIVTQSYSWPAKLLLAFILGACNGTMGLVCHELLHGSIIKNKKLQHVLGFFGAIPFFISPTFWKFWHNRLHHGKTQQLINDPDAFPVLRIYKSSQFMKFMFPFTPGSGYKRSYFYFFYWFSFHNMVAQVYLRFRNKIFSALDQKQVTLEFAAQILIGATLLIYAGPRQWLWVLFIPLFIQNYILMSYISTNHNISPLTSENDPLENSLTVTNHPVLEFLNLNFGYHVEHHIFPLVSSSQVKRVHEELKRQFPGEFKYVPKWKAIKALYSTPRIYKNSKELIHPKTGAISPTIGHGLEF